MLYWPITIATMIGSSATSSIATPDVKDAANRDTPAHPGVVRVCHPPIYKTPLVFASPHSGQNYPPDFIAQAALSLEQLRRSEDAFIDDLFGTVPECGAALVHALFPRVYLDPNRSTNELDPRLFRDLETDPANRPSTRALAGLGIVPRVGADGGAIYRTRLTLAEAHRRIETFYKPYHDALEAELQRAHATFGISILVDAHSMPSRGSQHVDVVIGDRHGTSSAASIVDTIEHALRASGFRTARNTPYAGGHSTQHYGRPLLGRHAVQIEINRGLYLDERSVTRSGTFAATKTRLSHFIASVCAAEWPTNSV